MASQPAVMQTIPSAPPPMEPSVSDQHSDRTRNLIILIVILGSLGIALVTTAGLVLYGLKKENAIGRFVRRIFCCSSSTATPPQVRDPETPLDNEKLSPQSAAQLATARPPSRLLQRPVSRQAMVEEGKHRVKARQAYAKEKQQGLLSALQEDLPESPPPALGAEQVPKSTMP